MSREKVGTTILFAIITIRPVLHIYYTLSWFIKSICMTPCLHVRCTVCPADPYPLYISAVSDRPLPCVHVRCVRQTLTLVHVHCVRQTLTLCTCPLCPADPPEVEVEQSTVYTGEGYSVVLVCLVYADPPAKVSSGVRRPSR